MNVKTQLQKFKNEPTPWHLARIADSIKFDFRGLDLITDIERLKEIATEFNTLVIEVENTFGNPHEQIQQLANKMSNKLFKKQVNETILQPLHADQQQLDEYMKLRFSNRNKQK